MYAFKHVWMCASVCLNVSLRACVCACESMHWMAASGPLLFPLRGVQSRRDTRFYEQTAADPRPAIWAITHSALGPHGKLDKLMPSDIQQGGEGENDYFSDCWYINVCVRGQSIGGWVMGGRDLWEKRWLGVVTCMLMQQQCNYITGWTKACLMLSDEDGGGGRGLLHGIMIIAVTNCTADCTDTDSAGTCVNINEVTSVFCWSMKSHLHVWGFARSSSSLLLQRWITIVL